MASIKPKLAVEEIAPSQFNRAMELQLRAFNATEEHLHHLIFPGDPDTNPEVVPIFAQRMASGRDEDKAAGAEVQYWQATDTESNDIAACALWEFWPEGHAQVAPKVTWVPDSDEGQDGALLKRYTQWAMDEQYAARARHLSNGPYAQLEILFTSIGHRRKGAGGLVVDAGVARAEELGLDAFIEASPEGRFLYETRGFRSVEDVRPVCPEEFKEVSGGAKLQYTFMKRPLGGWRD